MQDTENTKTKETAAELEAVRQLFEVWRESRSKRCRVPEELWQAAASLSPRYSVSQISKYLGIDYTGLKNRIHKLPHVQPTTPAIESSHFFELPHHLFADKVTEYIIEISKPDKSSMRIQVKGHAELDLEKQITAFFKAPI